MIKRCRRQAQPAFVSLERVGIGNVATVATRCQDFIGELLLGTEAYVEAMRVTGCMPMAASPMSAAPGAQNLCAHGEGLGAVAGQGIELAALLVGE
nr:hypothetical protein [Mesorhizobium mediterraneum]